MKIKTENYTHFYQQNRKGRADPSINKLDYYCDYLNQLAPSSESLFFPYYEKNFFDSQIENPLDNSPYSTAFYFERLKSIFIARSNHIKIADYQLFIKKYESKINIDNYNGLEIISDFLRNILAKNKDGYAEETQWFQERLLTEIKRVYSKSERHHYFLSKLMWYAINNELLSIYEKDIIDLIAGGYTRLTYFDIGTDLFPSLCNLLEKEQYEFILKLYKSGPFDLKKRNRVCCRSI